MVAHHFVSVFAVTHAIASIEIWLFIYYVRSAILVLVNYIWISYSYTLIMQIHRNNDLQYEVPFCHPRRDSSLTASLFLDVGCANSQGVYIYIYIYIWLIGFQHIWNTKLINFEVIRIDINLSTKGGTRCELLIWPYIIHSHNYCH